jgi:hypothetical protein
MPSFHALKCSKTLATHVFVGMGAASFWRGAWYVLDDHLFPDDPVKSASASLGLGIAGMAASQGLMDRAERLATKLPPLDTKKWTMPSHNRPPLRLAAARFGALYTVAVSCVLVWRGTWVGWDIVYEKLHPDQPESATDRGHATHSGLLSHFTALTLLLTTGLFASVLAPPAAVSVIRDFAVRAGQSSYVGPGQAVAEKLFAASSVRARSITTTAGRAASKLSRRTR